MRKAELKLRNLTLFTTKLKFTMRGLPSGKRFWFHVAAVNSAGQSGWIDPSTKIAS